VQVIQMCEAIFFPEYSDAYNEREKVRE